MQVVTPQGFWVYSMSMQLRRFIVVLVASIVGGAITSGIWAWSTSRAAETCQYKLINPFRCAKEEQFINPDYEPIRNKLVRLIEERKTSGVSNVGVYFRDLRNGPTFSIDSEENYLGMSILKLPVMVRYLKDAEGNPGILEEMVIAHINPATVNQNLSMNETISEGQSYSVAELLERMIRYSDNNSRTALVEHYAKAHPQADSVADTLLELGIIDPEMNDNANLIRLKSVASIFRILYNASYLDAEHSQKALTWLANSAYDNGLVRHIPSSITVANKYGLANYEKEKQLHDCGIVYYPDHPYLVCIMTKGTSVDGLEDTIADISKELYLEVDRRFGSSNKKN